MGTACSGGYNKSQNIKLIVRPLAELAYLCSQSIGCS